VRRIQPHTTEFREVLEAKILEADRLYPPGQVREKKAYVFRAIFDLVDIPGAPEALEDFLGQVLDDMVVPPLVALLRQVVQAVYDAIKRVVHRRRTKRWAKHLAE